MTNEELLAKIKAEIERMKVDYLNRSYTFVPTAMQQLLDFLSTLEEQPKEVRNPIFDECVAKVDAEVMEEVSRNIDIEDELVRYFGRMPEDDEDKMGVIIRLVEQNSGWPDRAIKEYVNWLKSIHPVKQEWSEEDERIRQGLIEMYKNEHLVSVPIGVHSKDIIRFLENLRPGWKPSEEHLSALLAVFNDPDNIGSQTCQLALTDLYEQLKKL